MRSTNGDLQKTINQNRKTVLENKYPSRSLGAAIPLRSAQTELPNTIELQHTTVEHIALMHQFQRTKYHKVSQHRHAKDNSTASPKKRKNHLQPSVILRAHIEPDSRAKRRRPKPSRTQANFSPQRNLCLPEITQFSCKSWRSNRSMM